MSDLIWLSEAQMRRIEPYFPLSHGVPRVDDRRVISGIIFVIRNGLRWRDTPKEYGPHKTIYNRFIRWSTRLWKDHLSVAPAAGWLSRVHDASRQRFRKNQASRHWQRIYTAAGDGAQAFAAHELVIASADLRIFLADRRKELEPWIDWSARRRSHWRLRFEDLNSAAKSKDGDYKKVFLATKPPGHAQQPRLR